MNKLPCPNCKDLTFTKWQVMKIGKFVNLRCSNCNSKVAVPTFKLVLFSLYSQLTGFFGLIALVSLMPSPFSITAFSIVGLIGYVVGLMPAVFFYINTTELISKSV